MKDILRITVLLAGLALASICRAGVAYVYYGTVSKICDGDTIIVEDAGGEGHRVRLYGIDAPELKQQGGEESRQHLEKLLSGKGRVLVEVKNLDLYAREVALVRSDGADLSRSQLREGWAWHYWEYNKLYGEEFAALEGLARREGLGIWKQSHPLAPWVYRRLRRNKIEKIKYLS